MIRVSFIVDHIVEIIFGLIASGALAFCKHLLKELKNYRSLIDEKEVENIEAIVQRLLEPFNNRLAAIEGHISADEKAGKTYLELILDSYRFRLVSLCKTYLRQGYMNQEQYDQLTEFYKVYHGMGGNGQVDDYYTKALTLSIKTEE